MRFTSLALAAAATAVSAKRPMDTPVCDYYTTALLKDNTADNQASLLTLLVNTVVIGNYTMPNTGVSVPGILAPGEVDGTKVDLMPYFSGGLASTNRDGDMGVSVNFLDGGGAEPLMKNMPANDDSSQQYFLLTHLYQYFGALLGCSKQGMPGFDAYMGHASMYEVHKFMDLNVAEVTYFIQQVGAAAQSFGVEMDDINAVAKTLSDTFNVRCAAPMAVIPSQGAQLQSICIEDDCPKAMNATCSMYDTPMEPGMGDGSMMPNGTSTMSMPGMATPTTPGMSSPGMTSPTGGMTVPTGGAASNGMSLAALAVGVAAFAL